MSARSKLPRASALQFLGVLSFLLLTLETQALTVSPSPSYNGNYVVSWSSTLGCTYNNDPPFYSYQCASLYENGIEIASSGYSRSITGKSAGSYQYRIDYVLYVYGQPYDAGTLEGPVSVIVGTPPTRDPLMTQLTYQYETRTGDINWDGKTDIFVRRTSGGVAGNGTLEQVILRQNSSGGTFSILVPNSSQAATASAWPTSSASVVVTDFNVDGFVDVQVKGVAAAVGVGNALDQIVFSPAAYYQPQPLGLRAVDAPLKQFVGNSLDYFVNPDYFNEYASVSYFTASYYWSNCSAVNGAVSSDPVVVDYSGGCFWVFQYLVGYYIDYTVFAGPAVAAWLAAESIENGQVSPSTGIDDVAEAAESVIGVEIGGWAMEEMLGATGEHTDANVRRALEIFWAILGIGRANAQEVETDEAPSQAPRTGSGIYLVGHGAKLFGMPTGDHVALEHNLDVGIPCVSNKIPTCQTISAHPRVPPNLYYVANAPEDEPLLNMLISTVERPPTPATALWLELKAKAEAYDNDAQYDPLCLWPSNGYNSNSFIVGLINVVNAFPGYDVTNLWCGSKPLPANFFD